MFDLSPAAILLIAGAGGALLSVAAWAFLGRRFSARRVERVAFEMTVSFDQWTAAVARLNDNPRISRDERRRELRVLWARFSRELEGRRLPTPHRDGHLRLTRLRDDLLGRMRAAFTELRRSELADVDAGRASPL